MTMTKLKKLIFRLKRWWCGRSHAGQLQYSGYGCWTCKKCGCAGRPIAMSDQFMARDAIRRGSDGWRDWMKGDKFDDC